ncbi:hypothetical protein [Deefgea rivuli]|uniref:hypothetical protein n=1 Tax=Deefgea rivuli TaxID=400948 RepID=UPI000482EB89|nr:hypothetical protein [Deefgea rivuli]
MLKKISSISLILLLSACAGQMSQVKKTQPQKKYSSIYIETNTAESSKLKITKNKSSDDNFTRESLRQSNAGFMHRVKFEIPEKLSSIYQANDIIVTNNKNQADLVFTLKTPTTLEVMCQILWCATSTDTNFFITDANTSEKIYSGKVLISSGVYWNNEYAKKKGLTNGKDEKDLALEIANKFFDDTKSFFK